MSQSIKTHGVSNKRAHTCHMAAPAILAVALSVPALAQNVPDKDPTLREYQGIVQPIRKVVFSARFDGLLIKINFLPGQIVKEGELVLEFSPTGKQLGLQKSEAQRERAEAELRGAQNTLGRFQKLGKKEAIATARIEDAEVARDIAAAKLKEARTAEQTAEFVLKNMQLHAPFTGVMSPPFVSVGTFIDLDSRTRRPLAEIIQLDPIWVVIKVPYNVFFERRMAAKSETESLKRATVTLVLPNGEVYPYTGRVNFADYKVDSEAQAIAVWAEFPNPDFLLRQGLKVTIQSRIADGK